MRRRVAAAWRDRRRYEMRSRGGWRPETTVWPPRPRTATAMTRPAACEACSAPEDSDRGMPLRPFRKKQPEAIGIRPVVQIKPQSTCSRVIPGSHRSGLGSKAAPGVDTGAFGASPAMDSGHARPNQLTARDMQIPARLWGNPPYRRMSTQPPCRCVPVSRPNCTAPTCTARAGALLFALPHEEHDGNHGNHGQQRNGKNILCHDFRSPSRLSAGTCENVSEHLHTFYLLHFHLSISTTPQ